jgi:drug/metabolite transporter (DMT)-like permease
VVTFAATLAGLPVLLAGLWLFSGRPAATDFAWGAAAGVCGGVAAAFIFRALAIGPVSVASPVLALTAMCLPVLVGLALGERPSPLAAGGILLAVLAIPLLTAHGDAPPPPGSSSESATPPVAVGPAAARPEPGIAPGPRAPRAQRVLGPALTAGVLAGGFLVCVGRVTPGAGMGPLVLARCVSLALFAAVLLVRRSGLWPAPAARRAALGSGLLDASANAAYFLAVQRGSLAQVAALVSLAPATTVLLARGILGERWSGAQRLGLVVALAAGVCISVG